MKSQKTSNYTSFKFADKNATGEKHIYFHEPPSVALARELRQTANTLQKAPKIERDLPVQEFMAMFSRDEMLRIVYIPHFITQCVIYYMDMLVDYAVSNRVSEIKRHTRLLRLLKDDYIKALCSEMPQEIHSRFINQREDYLNSCGANLTLTYFAFQNQLYRQFGNKEYSTIDVCANIIIALADYVAAFDRETNRRVSEILKTPCHNNRDARLSDVRAVCVKIAAPNVIKPNTDTDTCVAVMANKALEIVRTMK